MVESYLWGYMGYMNKASSIFGPTSCHLWCIACHSVRSKISNFSVLKVSRSVYYTYFKAMGLRNAAICMLLRVMGCVLSVLNGIWLSVWTNDSTFRATSNATNEEKELATNRYLTIYTLLGSAEGSH